MKCNVLLDNEKKDGRFTSAGDLNFGPDGFAVFYEIDGDKCLFTYTNGSVMQERRGSVHLIMRFTMGAETFCTIDTGEGSGNFPVYTDKIQVINDEKSVQVKLVYTCAGENIKLDLIAKAKE